MATQGETKPGRVLVIAGSDSSGGAGLEADQKVLGAHGVYGMTATTALTAQNTMGVQDIHHIPPSFVEKQIRACIDDIGVDVVKTGMLASEETIEMVAQVLSKSKIPNIVVDPVMISTSGATLLPNSAVKTLLTSLLPQTTILTPNIPEAILLLCKSDTWQNPREPQSVQDLEVLGKEILQLGPKWVLIKGGHLPLTKDLQVSEGVKEYIVDVLVGPEGVERIVSPWIDSHHTHGTGCSLASAIAANISKGNSVPMAVRAACRYVEAGIKTAPQLGKGHGPLNHFHSTYTLPFAPGYFVEYLLSREDVKPVWERFINHPFVMAMGDGTLPLSSFMGYIIQDYLYLIQFSRANALAAYKSSKMDDIARASQLVGHVMTETKLHIKYCESFGITRPEILATEEHQACTAYTRYVLDIGVQQDWLALQIAMAPCVIGYGVLASMLNKHVDTKREGNRYWPWIENYIAEDYTTAVGLISELLEEHMRKQSPARIEELVSIFIHATKMEIGFWEMYPAKEPVSK